MAFAALHDRCREFNLYRFHRGTYRRLSSLPFQIYAPGPTLTASSDRILGRQQFVERRCISVKISHFMYSFDQITLDHASEKNDDDKKVWLVSANLISGSPPRMNDFSA